MILGSIPGERQTLPQHHPSWVLLHYRGDNDRYSAMQFRVQPLDVTEIEWTSLRKYEIDLLRGHPCRVCVEWNVETSIHPSPPLLLKLHDDRGRVLIAGTHHSTPRLTFWFVQR